MCDAVTQELRFGYRSQPFDKGGIASRTAQAASLDTRSARMVRLPATKWVPEGGNPSRIPSGAVMLSGLADYGECASALIGQEGDRNAQAFIKHSVFKSRKAAALKHSCSGPATFRDRPYKSCLCCHHCKGTGPAPRRTIGCDFHDAAGLRYRNCASGKVWKRAAHRLSSEPDLHTSHHCCGSGIWPKRYSRPCRKCWRESVFLRLCRAETQSPVPSGSLRGGCHNAWRFPAARDASGHCHSHIGIRKRHGRHGRSVYRNRDPCCCLGLLRVASGNGEIFLPVAWLHFRDFCGLCCWLYPVHSDHVGVFRKCLCTSHLVLSRI